MADVLACKHRYESAGEAVVGRARPPGYPGVDPVRIDPDGRANRRDPRGGAARHQPSPDQRGLATSGRGASGGRAPAPWDVRPEIAASDFIDIYNVRIAIETGAIRLAAPAVLRRSRSRRRLTRWPPPPRAATCSKSSTWSCASTTRSVRLRATSTSSALFNSVAGQIRLALAPLDDSGYDDLRDIVVEHLPLVEVVWSGNEDAAAAMVQQHILSTVVPVLERLGGDPAGLLQRLTNRPTGGRRVSQ